MTFSIRSVRTLSCTALLAATIALAARAADPPASGGAAMSYPEPDSVVVLVGNRLFPDFREIVTTGLKERKQIGDTDFSFEVRRFVPHFAIIDSTKSVVSLTAEPENPAFRIMVYENDAAVDSTWAFFKMNAPHFTRKSALWFQVLEFDYRGVAYRKEAPEPTPAQAPHPSTGKQKEHP
jgi:hypothetical protein